MATCKLQHHYRIDSFELDDVYEWVSLTDSCGSHVVNSITLREVIENFIENKGAWKRGTPMQDDWTDYEKELITEEAFSATPEIEIMSDSGLELPQYATEMSAGMDLRASENDRIDPGETKLIHTGIKINIDWDEVAAFVYSRSGLAKKGISVANGVGVIDPDYQGEIGVLLHNSSREPFFVNVGERIAQLVFHNFIRVKWNPVTEFTQITDRGEGGFGSTGTE